MSIANKYKLVIVVSHSMQSFAPLYQEIAKRSKIDLEVIFLTDAGSKEYYDKDFGKCFSWNVDLSSGYNNVVLEPGKPLSCSGALKNYFNMDSKRITSVLQKINPDVILVNGYACRFVNRATKWARRNKKGVMLFGDSELLHQRSLFTRMVKRFVVNGFFKKIDLFLTIGDQNEKYYEHYGVPVAKLFRSRCPVNIKFHNEDLILLSHEEKLKLREKIKIGLGGFILLFVGKFCKRKRPQDMVKTIKLLRNEGYDVSGLFIGSGELLDSTKELAKKLEVQDKCYFLDFINQKDIGERIKCGDLLVVPSSEEPWGLVVTECGMCGVPAVVSDKVGCVGETDMLRPGISGEVFECGNIQNMAKVVKEIINDPKKFEKMRKDTFEIAKTQDIAYAAKDIEDAVIKLCKNN